MENDPIAYGLNISFNVISALMGLLGNGFVLHASLNHSAFKLDKITVLLIQNLAISDILYVLLVLLPSFHAYVDNKWYLGDETCYGIGFVGTFLASANLHFILFVSAHRFLKCVRPWKMMSLTKRHVVVISIIIWIFASLKIVILSAMGTTITFNNRITRCGVNYIQFGERHPVHLIFLWVCGKWVPFIMIFILNISLLVFARKRFGKTSTRGLMTISSVSILLILSWIPAQVYSIMGVTKYSSAVIVRAFEVAAYNFYLFSVFGNPLIYGYQNKYFAAFVKHQWKRASRIIMFKHPINNVPSRVVKNSISNVQNSVDK